MKWLVRIGAILLALVVVVVVTFAAIVFWDAAFGNKAQDYANVSWTGADGSTLYGYLAKPETPGPHPGVLMIHEFYGLNPAIVEQANNLAQEGYVVLAADTYRNQTTSQIPRAILLRITVPEERVMQDLQSAYDYLASQLDVQAERIAVLGFCYGGEMALQHALRNANLAAVVVLYGSPVTDVQGLGVLAETKLPVLGIFAEQDQQIPPAEAEAFRQTLNAAGIPNDVVVYPGVGHAFVQPETVAAGGAAREAWDRMVGFLNENLQQESSSRNMPMLSDGNKLAIADFRGRTLSGAAKFDAAYLCVVAWSHMTHQNVVFD